jgi:hypothetical protein
MLLKSPSANSPDPSSGPVTTPHASKSAKETSFLRVLLLITLTVTGLTAGGLCYYFIRHSQKRYYESEFFGMVNDHFKSTKNSFKLLLQANVAVATSVGETCPSASDWPNCEIASRELMSRTAMLSTLSGVMVFTVSPIVRPENRKSFEQFAAAYYERDGGYPEGAGSSGIYRFDGTTRVRSPNHTDPSTHRHDILVPFLSSSVPQLFSSPPFSFLSDSYDDPTVRPSIDEVLDCVNATTPSDYNSCSTITTFLRSPITFSSVGTPITPRNDPETVVGFTGATFTWEALFSTTLQHDFDFQFSIQSTSSPTVLTFKIKDGVALATTEISHASPSSDGFWKQSSKSFVLNPEDIFVTESKYTITYYSSTTAPSPLLGVIAGLCCVGITLIISTIFVVFNTLMSRAATEASMLLDSKRTYVRFVSHEIRSPSSPSFLSLPPLLPSLLSFPPLLPSSPSLLSFLPSSPSFPPLLPSSPSLLSFLPLPPSSPSLLSFLPSSPSLLCL